MDGDTADAANAAIIFRKIRPIIIGEAENPKEIITAIAPIRGFLWPREIIRQTTTGPIDDFTHCVEEECVDRKVIWGIPPHI